MPPSNEAGPPAGWAAWLQALWGDHAQLAWLQTSGGGRDARPVLTGHAAGERVLYLPPHGQSDRRWAAAAAAHAAAHWRFGAASQPRTGLKPVQQALLGVLEDARVEWLALQEMPGLRGLWLPFHAAPDAPGGNGFEDLLARLARSLLDPAWVDPHPWVVRGRREFFDDKQCLAAATPMAVRALASRLGNDIGQMRLPFNARTYRVHAAYRDDGSWLWQADARAPASDTTLAAAAAPWTGGDRQDGPPAQALAAAAPCPDDAAPVAGNPPTAYPEWDQRIGRYRHEWCLVYTCDAPAGARPLEGASTGDRRRLALVLADLVGGLSRPAGRAAWGDDFHLMALVDARIQQRTRQTPDGRVYRHRAVPPRRLAVQLLVDASASTGALRADGVPLLEHMLSVAQACAGALQAAGHQSALMTFSSRGRQRVEVRELKKWRDDALGAAVLARCAGQHSGGSTRLGTGVRHAAAVALAQSRCVPGHAPVVLVLSDGDVHDVDAPDPHYLQGDLRRALADSEAAGVTVRSLLLHARQPHSPAWTGVPAALQSV